MSGLPILRCGLFTASCLLASTGKPASGQILDPNDLATAKAMAQYDQEIDDFIAIVEKEETFESLVQGLNEPPRGRVPLSIGTAISPEDMTPIFAISLANRRVARLYEMLKQRPDPGRDCRDVFEDKLSILRRGLMRHVETWERGTAKYQQEHPEVDLDNPELSLAPGNEIRREIWELGNPPTEKFEPATAACAVAAAVFLSAEFCPVEEVLRQFDAWRAMSAEFEEHCQSPFKVLAMTMEHQRLATKGLRSPQPRFELSVLASLFKRRFKMEPGGTWEGDENGMAVLRGGGRIRIFDEQGHVPVWAIYQRVPLFAWNSKSAAFDFGSQPNTVLSNPQECIGEYLRFLRADLTGAENERQRIFEDLRKRLLLAEAEEAGKSVQKIDKPSTTSER